MDDICIDDVCVRVRLPSQQAEAVDRWREAKGLDEGEALRRLIALGLSASPPAHHHTVTAEDESRSGPEAPQGG